MCIPAPVAAALAVVQGIGEYKAASAATKAHNQQAEANNINAAKLILYPSSNPHCGIIFKRCLG